MSKEYPYSLTNESVTIFVEGRPKTFRRGTPNYTTLRQAILDEDWESIEKNLTVNSSLEQWAKGKFKVSGNKVYYAGEEVPGDISRRLFDMASRGDNPTPLFKFWGKLQHNPSYRSVTQLFEFLQHEGIPIHEDGDILAYKSVTNSYLDHHSKSVSNRPGTVNEMPRNKISDDPNIGCHYGFHVGALAYAHEFGGEDSRIIICKVNPRDVVCVPYDHNYQKMRVCRYEVYGNHSNVALPSTVYYAEEPDDYVRDLYEGPGADTEYEDFEEDYEDLHEETSQYDEDDDDEFFELDKEDEKNKSSHVAQAHHNDEPASDEELADMPLEDLLKQPIGVLRSYASRVLKIIGASKIPGGKLSLVNKIMEVRSGMIEDSD